MKPTFRVIADGQEITGLINDRLLSMTVTDEAGVQSDTATIVLDDRDNAIELPPTGAELVIYLGYTSPGLVKMGLFTVDEIALTGSPDTITISCKAADMRTSLKEKKTRSWPNTTLGDIIKKIANEHGLQPAIAQPLASISIKHIDQTNESDLHLITRLAKQHDAVAKPANGYLLYVPRGEAKTASGQQLTSVSIDKGQCIDFSLTMADRGKYQKVIAHWHDTATGQKMPVSVKTGAGDGKPAYTLRHTHPDEATALIAATAKLAALKRGQAFGHFTITPADTDIMAEGKIIMTGFRKEVNGEWSCTRVEYQLDNEGLSASVDFETHKP
jgi:phage protein D